MDFRVSMLLRMDTGLPDLGNTGHITTCLSLILLHDEKHLEYKAPLHMHDVTLT